MQTVCPKCNTLNPISNQFCGNCGASLESANVVQEAQPAKVESRPKRSNLALLLVLLIASVCVVIWLLSRSGGNGGLIGATPTTKATITVLSAVQGESRWGRTQVVVRVRNGSGRTAVGVEVHADCYLGGTVVATDWMPVKPREFEPGQESTQDVTFGEGVVCDDIKVWTDVFRWE